jgi:hypothetical protein
MANPWRTTKLEMFSGAQISGDRSYQKQGYFLRQVRQERKGHPTSGPREF